MALSSGCVIIDERKNDEKYKGYFGDRCNDLLVCAYVLSGYTV